MLQASLSVQSSGASVSLPVYIKTSNEQSSSNCGKKAIEAVICLNFFENQINIEKTEFFKN